MKRKLTLIFALLIALLPLSVFQAEGAVTIEQVENESGRVTLIGNSTLSELAINVRKTDGVLYYIDQVEPDDDGTFAVQFQLPTGDQAENYEVFIGQGGTIEQVRVASSPAPSKPGPGSGGGNPVESTVTLSVIGDAQRGTIFPEQAVTFVNGDTPYSVLVRALGNQVETSGSGHSLYVSGIAGLREFDHGPESGWMYAVNGQYVSGSAGAVALRPGDRVEWRYTKDGGIDIGERPSPGIIPPGSPLAHPEENKAGATEPRDIAEPLQNVIEHILKKQTISDWEAFALQRAGATVPSSYLNDVQRTVQENGGQFSKVTDLERLALALAAIGHDPTSFAGYNFIETIYNDEQLTRQGTNGVIFALIALDSKSYDIPANATWTRDKLIDWLIAHQNEDGGWPLAAGSASSVDLTGMALAALAPYQSQPGAAKAIEKAVRWLSDRQQSDGGYDEFGEVSSESVAQVIQGLAAVGIDPLDARFVKEEGDLLSALLAFQQADGGFAHLKGSGTNPMATEQALAALVAYDYYKTGKGSIYRLTDEPTPTDHSASNDRYVDDALIADWAKEAVYRAREMNIMRGTSATPPTFAPKEKLTRAQFVTLLHHALGEQPTIASAATFSDVEAGSWHEPYVLGAYAKGWVKGVSADRFAPNEPISRQDLAVMLANALTLSPSLESDAIKDIEQANDYARNSIRAVYQERILIGYDGYFRPNDVVTREMAAVVATQIADRSRAE